MLRLNKTQLYTPRSFNNCFVSLLHKNKTIYKGIIRRYKNKKDKKNIYYRIGGNLIRANLFLYEGKIYIKNLVIVKNKRFKKDVKISKKNIRTVYYYKLFNYEVDFYVHVRESKEFKRDINKNKKRNVGVKEAVAKMHKLYNDKKFVWIINKSGWYYQCPLVDAFFIGNNSYTIKIENKVYRADYFVIDIKDLFSSFLKSRKRYYYFLFVLELFEQTPIYFRNSVLYNVLQKTKFRFNKIFKERDIKNEKRKNQTEPRRFKKIKTRTSKKINGSQKKIRANRTIKKR